MAKAETKKTAKTNKPKVAKVAKEEKQAKEVNQVKQAKKEKQEKQEKKDTRPLVERIRERIAEKKPSTKVKTPKIKEILKSGVQFGHETKRWNPKFAKYLFGEKEGVHIIDIAKTMPLLEAAGDFLAEASKEGPILFLGSKRQASDFMQEQAEEIGVHFITHRWAGGFLTNFNQIKDSLKRLRDLEKQFEEGVKGRTKYEISQMKKDWERLNRLYGGVKQLDQLPAAVFLVDPTYESGPIRECNYLGIPVVAMVDSTSDPSYVDYPIPANDDAIRSIKLIVSYVSERIAETDSIYKIKHELKDYSEVEVEAKRIEGLGQSEQDQELIAEDSIAQTEEAQAKSKAKSKPGRKVKIVKGKAPAKKGSKGEKVSAKQSGGGILSKYQEGKEKSAKARK